MSEGKSTEQREKKTEPKSGDESDSDNDKETMDTIRKLFVDKLRIFSTGESESGTSKVIEDLTFAGLIDHWKKKPFKNVITLVGAGISTSAGIPDFRSPGSGLYDNLQKYKLPHPQAIFELDYFEDNPKPFFALAKELYPGTFIPTPSHYFVRLLHDKGLLVRHYTQNIDTLERIAGIPEEKLVEAHGTFYTNHCLGCRKPYSMEWMKEQIFSDVVPSCDECNFIVKPDIVFFGENLPQNFYDLPPIDFRQADLVIIMGTSLEVQPFASLVGRAEPRCIRLLINRTKVGNDNYLMSSWFSLGPQMLFDSESNTRDIAYIGDCDDGVMALVEGLGWKEDLLNLMETERKRLNEEKDKPMTTDKSKDKSSEKPSTSKKQVKSSNKKDEKVKPKDKSEISH